MKRLGAWGIALALLWANTAGAVETVYYIHTDALGSPVAMTDAGRHVVERTQYGPYGEVLNRPEHDGPGYTGHEEDAATGLTNMQQRYDDKVIGRMLSVDPVQPDGNTGGSFNRYAYANDNPYRYTDPDGRCTGSLTDHCDSENLKTIQVGTLSATQEKELAAQRHPITRNERAQQAKGDVKGFWESRRNDGAKGIVNTALSIWAPEDVLPADRMKGEIVKARLEYALIQRDGVLNPMALSMEMAYIGKDVAGGYISAVDANKGYEPSLRQLNAIHYQVFTRQGLGSGVYGGTPFGYSPTGGWKTWGDLQSVLVNKVFGYCDGCSE